MPFPTRSGSRAGTAGRECPAKNAETMISAVYYIFLVLLCTFFMILSALALVVCYPFDKGRRVVHELSRILVRTFFAIPPRWRQRVEGLEHVDRKKSYVIVLNHNTVIDIPTLYYMLDGTKTLIRKNAMFNWGNRITIRVLPPVPAAKVVSTETHVLMEEVHDAMSAALAQIRNRK